MLYTHCSSKGEPFGTYSLELVRFSVTNFDMRPCLVPIPQGTRIGRLMGCSQVKRC